MFPHFALLFLLSLQFTVLFLHSNQILQKNTSENSSHTISEDNQNNKKQCLFCQWAPDKEIQSIFKFKHCFAVKDNFPVSDGHLLIIPYQHFDNWFSTPQEIQNDIMNAINKLKIVLDAEYKPDGYNIGMNCGQAAGQTVMHLHVHLIPRYKGDIENPKGGVRGVIPSKQNYQTT